ncbi:Uncharacterized protein dnm_028360 [Desulfonema magnum]|uniref:Uncharacterized protein n=1 Tax=Desulfonema magnum TaxID=45655 RepID=A0A975BJN7_9BACT|nr:Uncharacterized protein dnm_028360 [Desulfonema magnum]
MPGRESPVGAACLQHPFIMPGRESPAGAACLHATNIPSPAGFGGDLQTCCYKYAAPAGFGGDLQTCCYKYAAPAGFGRPPLHPL